MREKARLERGIEGYRKLDRELEDTLTLIELAEAENDTAILAEADATLTRLRDEAGKRELESLLSGEADGNDAYLEVHSGAGGTEAQDWAEMLLRMYIRWAEAHEHKVEWIEESAGEGAGLKSATIRILGEDAYGWLKTESGVHRLVRISPFDANARRQTSFASVWVYPVVDDKIEVTIEDKYLRVDTYRSSGAGGQHVNKTDSAVRLTYQPPNSDPVVDDAIKVDIKEADVRVDTMRSGGAGGQHVNKTESAVRLTHIPTGLAVVVQAERSQHKNRAAAWKMLRARLYELELQKREAQAEAMNAAKTDIGWGHQIRSYVLQPYQMVKDLRTGVEIGNAPAVLDGDIDRFLSAALAARIEGADAIKAD